LNRSLSSRCLPKLQPLLRRKGQQLLRWMLQVARPQRSNSQWTLRMSWGYPRASSDGASCAGDRPTCTAKTPATLCAHSNANRSILTCLTLYLFLTRLREAPDFPTILTVRKPDDTSQMPLLCSSPSANSASRMYRLREERCQVSLVAPQAKVV
jgi:hypothetical protein